MTLDFEVTPAVLVPNPDTETLVQRAVEWGRGRPGRIRIADVGTGSGCIAVALAHYLPAADLEATDDDEAALHIAARNVERHVLGDRVRLSRGDLLAAVEGPLDAVVANLPYVAAGATLPAEVAAQPAHALFGGATGGELIERLLVEAAPRLAPGGVTLVEADPAIMPVLAELAGRSYQGARVHRDLGGHDRVLEAWRS